MKHLHLIAFVICAVTCIVTGVALALSPDRVNAGVLYVAPGGNCGGVSPCYGDIQTAVNAAGNGDEIRIAQGSYSTVSTGGGVTAVVRIINKKLTLTGGYAISNWNLSQPAANPTIIDANLTGVGIFIRYQADIGLGAITLDGLHITAGNAATAVSGTDSGGGIFIDHTTHIRVTVQNCRIYGNVAEDGSGGGIWTTRSDNLHLLQNEVYDNQGSGIVVTYGDNTVIVNNVVRNNSGKGISVISDLGGNTDISGNQASNNAGSGINLNTATGGSLHGNLVTGNQTSGGGGGLDIAGVVNQFLISNNTIQGNTALQGGGIDISGSVAEISHNLIEANSTTPSSNGGGGLYVDAGASGAYVLVTSNQILSNTTTNHGGGLLVLGTVDVVGNTIRGNSATSGGGIVATATGTISQNLITGNTAQSGGGIRAVNPMGLLLERNLVRDNQATNGGGMNLWGGFFIDVALDGNRVLGNSASAKGGGIYLECPTGVDPIDIANTVLAANLASNGSGLYVTVCDVRMAYNTAVGNRGAWGDGVGFYLRDPAGEDASYTIENTIVVSQTVGIYVESGQAALEATFWGADEWANDADTGGPGSLDGGTLVYTGNPLFVDAGHDDFHILAESPVIDKGINTWKAHDMDGQPRPQDETDIGADEYWELLLVYLPLVLR